VKFGRNICARTSSEMPCTGITHRKHGHARAWIGQCAQIGRAVGAARALGENGKLNSCVLLWPARFTGIQRQIDNHLRNLCRIGPDCQILRWQGKVNIMAHHAAAAQKLYAIGKHLAQILRPARQIRP
jgi:hypothetical protein